MILQKIGLRVITAILMDVLVKLGIVREELMITEEK